MRDIDRIDVFCDGLAKIWKKKCPDWRFGQFMINVLNSFDRDPWFYEEDEMPEKIKAFFEPKP
jgi:hypothetical protein